MELDISNNTNNNEDNVASEYDNRISQQDRNRDTGKFLVKASATGCQSDLEHEEETDRFTESDFHQGMQLANDNTTAKKTYGSLHIFRVAVMSLAREIAKVVSQKVSI